MQQLMIRNGTPFSMQQLKIIKGKVPQSIQGSYIKNGPGLYTIGQQVLPHWFMGNGGLLKIQFHDGKAFGMYKMIETPAYKRDITQKNFNRPNPAIGALKKLLGFSGKNDNLDNWASTSILRKPNSNIFYALYQGGLPFALEQKSMKQKGFEDFGFVRKGFSAHPKIDPENGDIFNIGFNVVTFDVYRMTKDYKLLAKNTTKLRVPQSIHDCCLAGDYLIVFECPVKLDMWKFLKGNYGPKCYSVDFNYGKTIAYIYKKQNLQLVKRMQFSGPELFFMFHFTNGYVENNKIFVEYVKYPGQNAQTLLQIVDYVPNYAKKEGDKKQFSIYSQLQTMQINLQDFSYKFHTQDISCEFPLCEDHEVGKKWQYSYAACGQKGLDFSKFDKLVKYDRFNDKAEYKHFPGCCIVEPSLIRSKEGLYILVLKSSHQRCSIQILDGEKLQTVAQIELPEHIPYGFHGKWLEMESKQFLETEKL